MSQALFKYTPIFLSVLMYFYLPGCRPSLTELAEADPESVIARKNEFLARKSSSPETILAVTSAHNNLGSAALKTGDLDAALTQFNATLVLDKNNKKAKYGLAMIAGHRLFKKGSRTNLWDSLEKFGQASFYDPTQGEPHYWMGRAYEKKDDGDFELIMEAYEKALVSELAIELKKDATARLEKVKKRQKTLEDFWK